MSGPPDRGKTTGTPLWVKIFGAILIVLAVLLVIMLVFGGGNHGPGRHMPSGYPGGKSPPTENGGQRT